MGSSIRGAAVLVLLVIVVMMQAAPHHMGFWQMISTGSRTLNDTSLPLHTDEHEMSTPKINYDKVLKTYWIHRDHPDSPRSHKSSCASSFAKRVAAAATRSLARSNYLSRRLVSSEVFDSQVMAESGDYSMAVSVGTPPQQFIATADTGSDLVWLNCLPCIQCINGSNGPPFNPTASTSYSALSCNDSSCLALDQYGCGPNATCEYFYSYGDGSTTEGELASETFTVTNLDGTSTTISDVTFGCGQNQSDSFQGTDGLVGLGQGNLSLSSQFQDIYSDIFSYCLVPFTSTTTNVSTFYFGKAEGNNSLVYTSIIPNPNSTTYYYVNMMDISVGNTDLNLAIDTFAINTTDGSGGIIVDSGTTLTLLYPAVYQAMSEAIQSQIQFPTVDGTPYNLDLCFDISSNPSSFSPPTMVFYFPDATVTGATLNFSLASENIYVSVKQNSIVCVQMGATNQSGDISIIGNVAQANHQIVFNRVNGLFGWETATC